MKQSNFLVIVLSVCSIVGTSRGYYHSLGIVPSMRNFWETAVRNNPVHYAADTGDLESLKILLAEKIYWEFQDANGLTPVHYAAQRGHLACLNLLLAQTDNRSHYATADMYGSKGGKRPLHGAAYRGHVDCVAALLRAGASSDTKDTKKFTALHYAAQEGKVDCLKLMLEQDSKKSQNEQIVQALRILRHCIVQCLTVLLNVSNCFLLHTQIRVPKIVTV